MSCGGREGGEGVRGSGLEVSEEGSELAFFFGTKVKPVCDGNLEGWIEF